MISGRKKLTILPDRRDNYRERLDELQSKVKQPTLSGIAVKRKTEETK